MQPTRDARTARRKLSELGVTSATVLTGSTTITIDLAAFDALCRGFGHWHPAMPSLSNHSDHRLH